MIKKIFDIATIATFLLVIFAVPILTKLSEHEERSYYENRALAAPPEFTLSALFDQNFFADCQTYYADHVWQRERINKVQTFIEINLLRRPVVNDIVITKTALLPKVLDYDLAEIPAAADYHAGIVAVISDFVKSYGGAFVYVGVPEQQSLMRNLYPDYLDDGAELLDLTAEKFFGALERFGVDYINMAEIFADKDALEYYTATDHHYNLKGAYLTYLTIMNRLNGVYGAGLPVLEDVKFEKLPNKFLGSRNRKLCNLFDFADPLYVYAPTLPFIRKNNGNDAPASVFAYPWNTPEENLTYNVYMGGDVSETIIYTNRVNLPSALMFGESFTNALETFLFQSFDATITVDPRHNDEDVLEYLKTYQPTYVFCLRDDTAYLKPMK